MKKILFVAGITVIGLSAAFAQDVKQTNTSKAPQSNVTARSGVKTVNLEELAQRKTDRLSKALTLSETQKKSVHDIFLKEGQQTQGRAVQRKETEDQIKAVLTPEQSQRYETLKVQRQQMMEQRQQRSALKAAPAATK